MTANLEIDNSVEVIELAPNYKLPLALMAIAIASCLISFWLAGIIALFSLFLTIQTVLIRLQFSSEALIILRSGKVIRSFPYSEWSNWKILWSPIPIWFYFREVNSIHSLPIIFDSKTFVDCLQKYCPLDNQ